MSGDKKKPGPRPPGESQKARPGRPRVITAPGEPPSDGNPKYEVRLSRDLYAWVKAQDPGRVSGWLRREMETRMSEFRSDLEQGIVKPANLGWARKLGMLEPESDDEVEDYNRDRLREEINLAQN